MYAKIFWGQEGVVAFLMSGFISYLNASMCCKYTLRTLLHYVVDWAVVSKCDMSSWLSTTATSWLALSRPTVGSAHFTFYLHCKYWANSIHYICSSCRALRDGLLYSRHADLNYWDDYFLYLAPMNGMVRYYIDGCRPLFIHLSNVKYTLITYS